MATPHKVVVTAKTGPDKAVTAMNILNVESFEFDLLGKKLLVEVDQSVTAASPTADGQSDNVKEFDLAAAATITIAIAAGAYTLTVA